MTEELKFKKGDLVYIVVNWGKYVYVKVRVFDAFLDDLGVAHYLIWRKKSLNDKSYWGLEECGNLCAFATPEDARENLYETIPLSIRPYVGSPTDDVLEEIPTIPDDKVGEYNKIVLPDYPDYDINFNADPRTWEAQGRSLFDPKTN